MWIVDLIKHAGGGHGAGPAAGAGRALADGRDGRLLVVLCVAGVGRLQPAHHVHLSGIHRPAVQQVLAYAGRLAQAAHRAAARQVRLQVERTVRDGRLAPQLPRQRLLHRVRQDQAHRVLRHADLAPERERGRSGARARAGPLQAASRDPAHGLDVSGQPGVSRTAGLYQGQGLVLPGPGRELIRPAMPWR